MLDKEGYPTKATLNKIRKWKIENVNGLLDFIADTWKYGDWGVSRELSKEEKHIIFAEKQDKFLRLATGGWSGNESIIQAFKENKNWAWFFTWQLSAKGGLFIFKYSPFEKQKKEAK